MVRAFSRRFVAAALALAVTSCSEPAPRPPEQPTAATDSVWITLGTQSGPIPMGHRSEPANLLVAAGQHILVDVGDGAAVQIGRAGFELGDVQSVFISHLHFDHTGGLYAFLGMRYQSLYSSRITVYGPPGTRALVDGVLAAMTPSMSLVRRGELDVQVEEIGDGSRITLGDIVVTAAKNSHYVASGDGHGATASLAFRFDLPDRVIAYTGDTGPSDAVERLAHDADLLVSEVMDVDIAIADIRARRPDVPEPAFMLIRRHFEQEHLTPEQAGRLAANARARRLVLTHVAGDIDAAHTEALTTRAAAAYSGEVVLANDLDRF